MKIGQARKTERHRKGWRIGKSTKLVLFLNDLPGQGSNPDPLQSKNVTNYTTRNIEQDSTGFLPFGSYQYDQCGNTLVSRSTCTVCTLSFGH